MKTKKILPALFFAAILSACSGHSQNEKNNSLNDGRKTISASVPDTVKPDVRIKVNKQYDNKGNIIKYDSTYSYYYSGPKNGTMSLNNDSVFSSFKKFFYNAQPDFYRNRYNDIFFNDSLFQYDFFNHDYFMKRFEMNQKLFENMFREMDSMKQDFLKRSYPNGQQKKTQKDKEL